MDYIIAADASCDLIPELIEKHNIYILPMEYSLKDKMYISDGKDEDDILKELYDGQRNGDLTSTSQISPFLYEEYFKPFFEQGKSIIYLSLSGGLSSTFQSANIAKNTLEEQYPGIKLFPIDSLSASGGIGVLLERAIRNREANMSIEENANDLLFAIKHIRHWFLVQDLLYLKRGGRISSTAAMVGTMLAVKPILEIDRDGKLITVAKARGNKAAIKEIMKRFLEVYDDKGDDVIYIIHSDAFELVKILHTEITKIYPEAIIRESMLSPIIGAHTGPSMAAICCMEKS